MRVPAGVADGQRIRVKGRGGAGANGGPPGDLYVVVHVRAHPLFGRSGNDLTLRLPVTFAEAALGADVKVPTLDGQVTVRIPPGTPSGKVLRVRGKGVAATTARRQAGGDLLVTVDVQVPIKLERASSARRSRRSRRCSTTIRAPTLFARRHDRRKTADGADDARRCT